MAAIRIGVVDFLVVLHDVPVFRIIVAVDAFLESAANLAPLLLIDVLVDLGLQPIQLTLGDPLEKLTSRDLGGGGHC